MEIVIKRRFWWHTTAYLILFARTAVDVPIQGLDDEID